MLWLPQIFQLHRGSVCRVKEKNLNASPKEQEKGKGKIGKEEEEEGSEDWEEITHTEALPDGKPGEFGVLELDE